MRVLLLLLCVPSLADDPLPVDGETLPPCYFEWAASTAERVSTDPSVAAPCGPWDVEYWDGAGLCVYWCGSELVETTVAVIP